MSWRTGLLSFHSDGGVVQCSRGTGRASASALAAGAALALLALAGPGGDAGDAALLTLSGFTGGGPVRAGGATPPSGIPPGGAFIGGELRAVLRFTAALFAVTAASSELPAFLARFAAYSSRKTKFRSNCSSGEDAGRTARGRAPGPLGGTVGATAPPPGARVAIAVCFGATGRRTSAACAGFCKTAGHVLG